MSKPRAERDLQTDDFGDYVYIRFSACRAKYCKFEQRLVIQHTATPWLPPTAPRPFWEWQDRVNKPCASKEDAERLFIEYLDARGIFV